MQIAVFYITPPPPPPTFLLVRRDFEFKKNEIFNYKTPGNRGIWLKSMVFYGFRGCFLNKIKEVL
jgi:hypothetical protein